MKRITAIILSLLMIISVFVGCGESDTKKKSDDEKKDNATENKEDGNSNGYDSCVWVDISSEEELFELLEEAQLKEDNTNYLYVKNEGKSPEVSVILPELKLEGYQVTQITSYEDHLSFLYLPGDRKNDLEARYDDDIRIIVQIYKTTDKFEKCLAGYGVTPENGVGFVPEHNSWHINNGKNRIIIDMADTIKIDSFDELDSYVALVEHTFKTAYFESAE